MRRHECERDVVRHAAQEIAAIGAGRVTCRALDLPRAPSGDLDLEPAHAGLGAEEWCAILSRAQRPEQHRGGRLGRATAE